MFFSIEEAETLGVQELPRSSSSLSMRTDASGTHGEHASSDSFYDSDNTEAEAAPPQSTTKQTHAPQTAGKSIFFSLFFRALDNLMFSLS